MWGTGARAGEQLSGSLAALADDPAVAAVALAVDLVPEFDGDRSYPAAVTDAARRTGKPVVVLSNLPAAIDAGTAAELRAGGIPVLEGTRTGLLALGHLLRHGTAAPPAPALPIDQARRARWSAVIAAGQARGAELASLLRDYSIPAARARAATTQAGAVAAAAAIGYPVVLKTDEPGIAHKSDAGGVVLGLAAGRADRGVPGPGRAARPPGAGLRDGARGPRNCPWAWPGTMSWGRCWWWARAGCWWNCSPTGP